MELHWRDLDEEGEGDGHHRLPELGDWQQQACERSKKTSVTESLAENVTEWYFQLTLQLLVVIYGADDFDGILRESASFDATRPIFPYLNRK